MVLELAVTSNSKYIITYNKIDFKWASNFGISLITPKELLFELGEDTMSALSIRLPESLHKKVKEIAHRDKVSINQMITLAVAEKLSALETEDYLGKLSKKGNKQLYLKALKRVSNRKPDKGDEL